MTRAFCRAACLLAVLWTGLLFHARTNAIAAPDGFSDPTGPSPIPWPEYNPIVDSDTVGYLPGSGSVTSKGDYQYTMPLAVPDGRAGVQPAVSLVYNSSGGKDRGQGPLGVGWSVAYGGSQITPCARNFVPDETVDGPHYRAGDALCLDGQRLIPVPGTAHEYRTFRDQFAKIVAVPGPQETALRFKIFTRNGRIRVYEAVSAKRIPPTLTTQPNGEPGGVDSVVDVTATWLLSSERDRSGNAMLFSYVVDSEQTPPYAFEHHIASITYTASIDDSEQITEAPRREIVFEYSKRPDVSFTYQNGLRSKNTKRLTAIKLYAPNPHLRDLIGQYRFTYDSHTPSRVTAVSQYDDSGFRRLWERRFEWALDDRPRFAVVDPPHLKGPYHGAPLITFDVENDGRDDLYLAGRLCRTTATSLTPFDTCEDRAVMEGVAGRFVDVNGDGKVEVLKKTGLDEFRFVTWNNVLRQFEPFSYGVASTANLIDANGDGLVDAFVIGSRRNPYHDYYEREWYLRLNNGQGFNEGRAPNRAVPYMQGRKSIVLDLNGDGRGELHTGYHPLDEAEQAPGEEGPRPPSDPPSECARWIRQPWQYDAIGLTNAGAGVLTDRAYFPRGSPCRKTLADLNGDGLQDIVVAEPHGLTVRYNTGTGFLPSEDVGTTIFPRLGKHTFEVADIDGDGREDLISSNETGDHNGIGHLPGTYLHLRTDDGFHKLDLSASPYHIPAYDPRDFPPNRENASPLIRPADVNGDGLQDLVVVLRNREEDTSSVRVLVQQWAAHNVIVKVWDEYSPEPRESISYSPYTTDAPSAPACIYPARCLRGGMVVVREHWRHRQDAPEAFRRTTYEFDDFRMNARARTFLGFGRMTTVDMDSRAQTIVTFDHTTSDEARFPFAGLPQEIWQVTPILPTPIDPAAHVQLPAVGPMTARVTHTRLEYERRLTNEATTFAVFETAATVKKWEQHVSEDGTLLDDGSAKAPIVHHRTRSFDAYGGEITSATWTEGGQRCETSTPRLNDMASWLLGLAERVSTTCNEDGQTLPEPRLQTMEYDSRGLVSKVTVEPGEPSLATVTTYTRRNDGQVMNMTVTAQGMERKTYVAYDEEGVYTRAVWNSLGHATQQLIHPAYGMPIIEQDIRGVQTRYLYDGFGRLREAVREGSARSTITYEQDADFPWAVRVHQEDETGGASYVLTDDRGQTLGSAHLGFDGQWIYQRVTRNRFGQTTEDYRPAIGAVPSLKTTTTYDTLGRVLEVVTPDNARTTFQHSMLETTASDPISRQSRTIRDHDGRLVQSLDHVNGQWVGMTYVYGKFGQLDDAIDPAGHAYHTEYDKLGRRTLLADPDRGVTRWTYNGFGEIESETDALGHVTKFERDIVGRVAASVHTVFGRTSYEYDGQGHAGEINQLTAATSPDGVTTAYKYDELGRPQQTTWTIEDRSYDVERTYDSFGRLETLRYPEVPGRDRFTVRYVFNSQGYVARVDDVSTGAAKTVWEVTERNADGLLTKATLGNGFQESRQYDPATGQVTNVEAVRNGSALFATSYARDLTGNIRTRTDHVPAEPRIETFTYDDLDRLVEWTVYATEKPLKTTYDYDLLGNLTAIERAGRQETFQHTAPQPHAPSTREVDGQIANYFYDARGRQIAGDGREISWKSFDLPAQIGQAGQLTTFAYDAFGKRVRKTRTSGGLFTEGTDSIGQLYERRWGPAHEQHVFYAQTPDGPAAQIVYDAAAAEPERALYLHREALGSVGLVTDNQGNEVERTYFDPFGEKVDVFGKPTLWLLGDVKLGFTGHRHDDELKLIHMGGRVFDPKQKRFLTPDPYIPDPLSSQSYNRYSYVTNNPLRYTDPTGFLPAQPAPERQQGWKVSEQAGEQVIEFGTDRIEGTPPKPGTPGTSDDNGPKPPKQSEPPAQKKEDAPPTKAEQQQRWTEAFTNVSWGRSQASLRQRLESSIRDVRTWVHDNIVTVPGLQSKSASEEDVDASGIAVTVYFDSTWLAPLDIIEQALAISDGFAVLSNTEANPEQKEEAALQATADTIVLGLTLGMVRGAAHGNHLGSTKPAQGYVLLNRTTGEVLKFGETTLGPRRYTRNFLELHNAELKVRASGTKKEMHDWQHQKILDYKATHGGKRPPLNKSDY